MGLTLALARPPPSHWRREAPPV